MHWYFKALRNYAVFSGRASRMEYWMYTLITTIISIIIMILDITLFDWQPLTDTLYGTRFSWGPLLSIYILLTFLPNLALSFRRLHDTDHSAWWLLISLVPLVGGIVLLVFYCLPGTQGDNRFGPDPKV
ncbi:DUF805 domain-containing protein [Enterobacteriaceae bacterium ESL0689]|nr:DUF805 domain-containing protein [Enterobacteriaceae bacterium ESL0689]